MDESVRRLKTPEECEQFIKNVRQRWPELVVEARRRSIELRAELHGAQSAAEREALRAVYAYEEVLSAKNGRRTPAARTWQMIKRRGIIGGVESAVNRPQETTGYAALIAMNLEDFAFEAVVVRYPELFSSGAVTRSKDRLAKSKGA